MTGVVYLSYANNPSDPKLANLRAEKEAVRAALAPWILNNRLISDLEDNTEIGNVLARLNDRAYAQKLIIFGFSGHAGGKKLLFNDEQARGKGLATLMRKENCPHLKIIFLNGCVTQEHFRFFEENEVPIIITTNAPVEDKKAMTFAATLFSQLAQGVTIYEAYRQAFGQVEVHEQVRERVRCYRQAGFFRNADNNRPIWEFAYREDRFKHWKLEMGMADPPEWSTLQDAPPETTQVLCFGEKHFKAIYGQFKDKIERKELALACLPLDSILYQRELVETEIEHADAVVFHLQQSQANEIFRAESFRWLPASLASKGVSVAFLNEDFPTENLPYFRGLFAHESPVVIPDMAGFDLALIAMHRPNYLGSCICSVLEKEVLTPIIRKIGLKEVSLLEAIENFDLSQQTEFLTKVSQNEGLNFLVLEGTAKCGLELLLKKILDYLSLERLHCYRVKFKSAEGTIDNEDKLYAKLYARFTGKPERPIRANLLAGMLVPKLVEGPICIILDDPLAVNEHAVIIKCWQNLTEFLTENPDLHPFYFIVINKVKDRKGWPEASTDGFENAVSPVIFPSISKIEEKHFNMWWGHHAPRIRRYTASIDMEKHTEQILSEPYLGSVLEKLCHHLQHPTLIDKILPKYE